MSKKDEDLENLQKEESPKNNNENSEKPLEKESLGDKFCDAMDDLWDTVYGPRHSIDTDIPATMEKDSGGRRILKAQTRRNLNKKFLYNKRTLKIVLIIFGTAGILGIIGWIINLLLMA